MAVELTVTVQEQPEGLDVSAILADTGMKVRNRIGNSTFHCELEGEDEVQTDEIKSQIEGTASGLKVTVMDEVIAW